MVTWLDDWPDPQSSGHRPAPDPPLHLHAAPLSTFPAPSPASRRRGGPEPVALQHAPYPGEWRFDAACRGLDTDLFFPRRGEDQTGVMAVCGSCLVQEECREYAFSAGALLQGVFGSRNERQRRLARSRRSRSILRPGKCACGADVKLAGQCWACYQTERRRARGIPARVYDPEERFWAKVDTNGPPCPQLPSELGSCWVWTAGRDGKGYGSFGFGRGVVGHASRWAYEHLVAPVPPGRHLDHICHSMDESCRGGPTCPHRLCVNPLHLQPVTGRENFLRGRRNQNTTKTHCKNGHLFDQTYTNGRTGRPMRACSICKREWKRRARQVGEEKQGRQTA